MRATPPVTVIRSILFNALFYVVLFGYFIVAIPTLLMPRRAILRLAQIWQEVLQVPRVGPHHNFFELGGDSIVSFQVVSRAAPTRGYFAARSSFRGCPTHRRRGHSLEVARLVVPPPVAPVLWGRLQRRSPSGGHRRVSRPSVPSPPWR